MTEDTAPGTGEWRWGRLMTRWKPWLIAALAITVGGLLIVTLRGLAADIRYQDIPTAVQNTQVRQLALALLATVISYAALTGYGFSSLRYVGAKVPYHIVAQTASVAYALSNAIGLGVLTGGAVRMRLYCAAGVEAGQISRAIAFNAVAFGLGISLVASVALFWQAALWPM